MTGDSLRTILAASALEMDVSVEGSGCPAPVGHQEVSTEIQLLFLLLPRTSDHG